jgi:excisionase family DNA binding protein
MTFLTTKQLTKVIHRTEPAIRNLVMRRRIPFRKPGGRLLFIEEEIMKWVTDAEGLSYEDLQKENTRYREM